MITLSPMRILDQAQPATRQESEMKHFRASTITAADEFAAKVRAALADALDVARDTITDETTLGSVTEENPWGHTARALAVADVEHAFGVDLPDALMEPGVTVSEIIAAVAGRREVA